MLNRRTFLQSTLLSALSSPLLAALKQSQLQAAEQILRNATNSGLIGAAALYVQQGDQVFQRAFGHAKSVDDIFLLASISKPISIAAVMKLYDDNQFELDDPVSKFIPEFVGDNREKITMRQLMTHVSGLPDQLPQNNQLRASHAPLSAFVKGATQVPLMFDPGTQYSYSSMGILLATEVAMRISKTPIARLVDTNVFTPLGMKHSALGLGTFPLDSLMMSQVEQAAPESGAGDPSTKSWDWNSEYWRDLGAPWGGAHGSAPDVARFLNEFLHANGKILKPETERMMVSNQNKPGLRERGFGFDVGRPCEQPDCGANSFGHTGSTGTLCWADPASETICVVLTTLPARALNPHPRDLASEQIAKAIG